MLWPISSVLDASDQTWSRSCRWCWHVVASGSPRPPRPHLVQTGNPYCPHFLPRASLTPEVGTLCMQWKVWDLMSCRPAPWPLGEPWPLTSLPMVLRSVSYSFRRCYGIKWVVGAAGGGQFYPAGWVGFPCSQTPLLVHTPVPLVGFPNTPPAAEPFVSGSTSGETGLRCS